MIRKRKRDEQLRPPVYKRIVTRKYFAATVFPRNVLFHWNPPLRQLPLHVGKPALEPLPRRQQPKFSNKKMTADKGAPVRTLRADRRLGLCGTNMGARAGPERTYS